jgi:hypothetical protein
MGRIVRAARKAGHAASGSDLKRRPGFKCEPRDFFTYTQPVPNIVSNPPFKWGLAFVALALVLAERKVAMLMPANWIQGDDRSRWLETTPLRRVLWLCPRPSMPPGPLIAAGIKPGNGTTDYAWFIWEQGYRGERTFGWLRRDDEFNPNQGGAHEPVTII